MSRKIRASIAQETIEIVERGWYELPEVGRIDIAEYVEASLNATALLRPHELDALEVSIDSPVPATRIEVRNETTLSAARRLAAEQDAARVLVLNFASAKNPGGGFRGGSQAQEESLARSSALYASLQTQMEYYEINRGCGTALYTDHMILSPRVVVFRDDAGALLTEPYTVAMLTSPATNAGAVRDNEPANVEKILPTMARRIEKVLAIARREGFTHLVLGAWGCGVFRNDPDSIATLFAQALLEDGAFAHAFEQVAFAVLDHTEDERIFRPFRQRFAGASA